MNRFLHEWIARPGSRQHLPHIQARIKSPNYKKWQKSSNEKNRYQQKGGGLLLGYLKIFAQEGLGRPDLDVESEFAGLKKLFKKEFSEDLPPLNAALVFLDPRAEINAEGAPYPALKPDGLKDLLRKAAKTNPLPAETIQRVNRLFHAEE